MKPPTKTFGVTSAARPCLIRASYHSALLLALTLSLSHFLTCSLSAATTWYWSATGSDGNDGLSVGTPKQTTAGLRAVVSAGDTILALDGTYSLITQDLNDEEGSFPSSVTWRSQNLWGAIIQPPTNGFVLHMRSGTNMVFDGFVLDSVNSGNQGPTLTDNSRYISLLNCKLINAWNTHGLLLSKGTGAEMKFQTVSNCVITNWCVVFVSGGDKHGAYLGSGGNIIDRNYIAGGPDGSWGIHGHGDTANGTNNIVRNNEIDGVFGSNGGIIFDTGDDPLIYNNIIRDLIAGVQIHGGVQRAKFLNNLIYRCVTGLQIGSTGGATDTVVGNNIIAHTTGGSSETGIILYAGAVTTAVRYNLCYSNANVVNFTDGGTGTTTSNNKFANTDNADFVDPANNDFTLQATSDALNNGETRSEFSTDIVGLARPQQSVWERGPYEKQSGVSTGPGVNPPNPGVIHDFTSADLDELRELIAEVRQANATNHNQLRVDLDKVLKMQTNTNAAIKSMRDFFTTAKWKLEPK